jgi:hypothetical protein
MAWKLKALTPQWASVDFHFGSEQLLRYDLLTPASRFRVTN